MAHHKALSRRYRPQRFADVLGQDAVVTTLKNAIAQHSVAHAYLFCGPRGTGKTTLARILAKAINCLQRGADHEPCNTCSACREISGGNSLDVLEIDGASNRGIEEIRKVRDTVGFSTANGSNRIYIIDEVHMLTNEAFNALLKTLEEPPEGVMFLFATTEPHKVLATILSRCQRFDLQRLPVETILNKLQLIVQEVGRAVDSDALRLVAQRADGGMRDAESLLDQLMAFHEGDISEQIAATILGVLPRSTFFDLDTASKEGHLAAAFDVAQQAYCGGKDIGHLISGLTEHYRNLLVTKLAGNAQGLEGLSAEHCQEYETRAKDYNQEQLLSALELLVDAQQTIRHHPTPRLALEALLLKLLRIRQRVPVAFLARRLVELEKAVEATPMEPVSPTLSPPVPPQATSKQEAPPQPMGRISEDPTPAPKEVVRAKPKPAPTPPPRAKPKPASPPPPPATAPNNPAERIRQQSRQDTLLQFAAVELEGMLEKKKSS